MNTRHLTTDDLRGKRWRGLVRESTAVQADKYSPERQRQDIRRAADELGLVPAEPLFYERVGSGEQTDVPEVAQAIVDARAGQFDVLLVLHTSRLARNRGEAIRVKAAFAKAGVVLYFVSQRILSGSRHGRLIEGISEVLDEEANEERRMWVAGGMRERQVDGRWIGKVPFGYRWRLAQQPDRTVVRDGGLEPDPERAPIVQAIFAAHRAGMDPTEIAAQLEADGVPAPAGRWLRRTVRNIIVNPVYSGTLSRYRRNVERYYPRDDARDGRRELPGDWPALV